MALSPGEVFQHTHDDRSVTMLVQGEVELEVEGSKTALQPGLPTPIDAHVSHTLVNVGRQLAVVECVHEQKPPAG